MQSIAKSLCLATLITLGYSAYTMAADEPTTREVAVLSVAVGRACAELHPEKHYTLQNMLDNPASAGHEELKADILKVDKGPEFQPAISTVQKRVKGEDLYMSSLCPSYAPLARKWDKCR